ncbi:putative E3 ubiquitin-protein ligase RHA2B [Acorus calamus]|uniref:E3 ubiquitin-protein ligase RHA2B n=1 Tax=Acorus calamus TaxID=4465 RepID=A0AAV9DE72_ACOCL|nr:putative E3 ubiquitin-protein ligase RHA2B [Acorus calamus]
MGLPNSLNDISNDSLPLLLLLLLANLLSLLRRRPLTDDHHHHHHPADNMNLGRAIPYRSAGGAAEACVFCFEGLREGQRVRRLGCRHVFHKDCIDGWFVVRSNLTCPVCRSPLLVGDDDGGDVVERRRIGRDLLLGWFSSAT